jgi:hypothetical protein
LNGVKEMANDLRRNWSVNDRKSQIAKKLVFPLRKLKDYRMQQMRFLRSKITGAGEEKVLVLARRDNSAINGALKGLDLCLEAIKIEDRGLTLD